MEEPVRCARPGCGLPYPAHDLGGPGGGTGSGCPGFLWVDPYRPAPDHPRAASPGR